ncbi:hypothetical protein OG439_27395 [Amycolatopsis sp. NBC_01307]|uniref:hypothetical protein n=1 Tax=Amycolatopsis sp. NBC_01307 TaxID=2903561 RepID=UPI002E16534F|nr:hypothetical protein OG439_27395 [Amycolatopsis sp. NBC_01307]
MSPSAAMITSGGEFGTTPERGLNRVPSTQPSDLLKVRESYDRVAGSYAELGEGRLDEQPRLRAALVAFVDSVHGLGPVLDVGYGPDNHHRTPH